MKKKEYLLSILIVSLGSAIQIIVALVNDVYPIERILKFGLIFLGIIVTCCGICYSIYCKNK